MTPEEILRRLYSIRSEIETKAIRRFELDIGVPYPPELKEVDEQIRYYESITPTSSFAASLTGKSVWPESRGLDLYSTAKKIPIVIDIEKGVYQRDEMAKAYSVKRRRYQLIRMLYNNNKALGADVLRALYKTDQLLSKTIREINELFRKKLEVENDLIVSVPTGGYKLNKENFDIDCTTCS